MTQAKKISIILDTNIFVNPDSRRFFGASPEEALNKFLQMLKEKENITCFIPPSIHEEFLTFIEEKKISKDFSLIIKRPPAKYEVPISALFLYEFIEDVRARINKGLRIAEKYTRRGAERNADEKMIKTLREEYRTALREGIIDSKEDFDLLLLAKELGAQLATSDNGLIKWAHKFGLVCLTAEELRNLLI